VHLGKAIALDLEGASESDAIARARAMCERLLANPVTEDFTVEVAA
jgi:phosphoribosylformylglycinamidine (FGAM) synthase PurS component